MANSGRFGAKKLDPTMSARALYGSELRYYRERKGLRLRELADKLHIEMSFLTRIEQGERRLSGELAGPVDQLLDTGGFFERNLEAGEVRPQVRPSNPVGRVGTARADHPRVGRRTHPRPAPDRRIREGRRRHIRPAARRPHSTPPLGGAGVPYSRPPRPAWPPLQRRPRRNRPEPTPRRSCGHGGTAGPHRRTCPCGDASPSTSCR